eukprot:scaffold29320_cov35-Tisochrysis_lutea.AAC.2
MPRSIACMSIPVEEIRDVRASCTSTLRRAGLSKAAHFSVSTRHKSTRKVHHRTVTTRALKLTSTRCADAR